MCATCRQVSRQTACKEANSAAGQVLEAKAAATAACVVSLISVCACVYVCVCMCVTCRQESRQTACEEAKCAAEQVLEAKAAVVLL